MKIDAAVLKEVDLYLEKLYKNSGESGDSEESETIRMGRRMADIKLKKTQIRGLQNMTFSTSRFSEIVNYIKNKAGKDEKKQNWFRIANDLLQQLDGLEQEARRIGKNDPELILDVKLRLARGWVKQIVSHYLYARLLKEGGGGDE